MGDRLPLFVYGSLMRGGAGHHHLEGCRFLDVATTSPGYALYRVDWYPAMREERSASTVHGELFDVDAQRLLKIDAWEQVPDEYRRAAITVHSARGVRQAFAYLYQHDLPLAARVDGGRWQQPELAR